MTEPASDEAFDTWWDAQDSLPHKLPYYIAEAAWDAATQAERQRITDALFELHLDATTHGGWIPGWHRFTELLNGDIHADGA